MLPRLSEFNLFSHRNTLSIFFLFQHFQRMSRLLTRTQEEIEVTRMHLFVLDSCPEKLLDSAVVWRTRWWISLFPRASELESSSLCVCVCLLTPTLLRQQPGADSSTMSGHANPIWSLANNSAEKNNSGDAASLNKAFRTMTLTSRDYETRSDFCLPRFEEQYLTAEQRSVNTSTLWQHCLLPF